MDKDHTWLQALPNEALRLAMKQSLDIAQGYYKPEILGAMRQPKGDRYNVDQFHKGTRVAKRFLEPFKIAYDSHVVGSSKGHVQENITENADDAKAAATADSANGKKTQRQDETQGEHP